MLIRNRLPGTPAPMHRTELPSGITIAADSWGQPNAHPVILLHGGGQTRHAWRGAGKRLGDAGLYAVAIDLRGHGDSAWDEDGLYSHDAFADDLVAFIEQHHLKKPVLVGASLGGAVSLLVAGEHRVDVGALVIVDTAPRIEQGGVNSLRTFMTQSPEGFGSLDEVADSIAEYNPGRARPQSTKGLAKNLRIDDAGRYHWHWDPRFMSTPGTPDGWVQREQRMERCARDLTAPTLLVRGGLSDLLSEEGAAGFLALCPTAEYVNIVGASHMVAGDRNDRFGDAAVEFLSRVVPR